MSVEETNKAQESSLSLLRQKIEASKKKHEEDMSVPFVERKRELKEIPVVLTPVTDLFQIERYRELCDVMDVIYNNYLLYKENMTLNANREEFENALKDLCKATDEMVTESCKVRWS